MTSATELRRYDRAWGRLLETVQEPNVFFEPEVLIPSLERFGDASVKIGLVLSRPRQDPQADEVLAGLFPVRARRGHAEIWQHSYAFQGTPLIRSDVAREVWSFFLEASFHGSAGVGDLLRCQTLQANGVGAQTLLEVLRLQRRAIWQQEVFFRAVFRPAVSAEAFIADSIGRKVRRNLRRQRRILEERGDVTTRIERIDVAHVDAWCDAFLALEASGWKGRGGTALGSDARDSVWFKGVARALAESGRFIAAELCLDGQPIAMGTMLQAAPHGGPAEAAYFKIAHDESVTGVSPGALLQLDWIEELHGKQRVGMIDSCAIPGHPMIERIWQDRKMIMTTWVGKGSLWSRVKLWLFQSAYAIKLARRSRKEAAATSPQKAGEQG